VESFSAAEGAGVRTGNVDRWFGRFYAQPFERGSRPRSATRCGAYCCRRLRRGDHRREDRRRAARVLPDPGIVEDATDIILNLKQIPLKLHVDHSKTRRSGSPSRRVRARDIQADADVEILEPDAHIATIAEGASSTWRCACGAAAAYVAATRTSTRSGDRLDSDRFGSLADQEVTTSSRPAPRPDDRLREG